MSRPLEDVKILLTSHAHWDHDAGSAAIKTLTGASYMVMEGDVSVVESGGKTDFRFGDTPSFRFEPVTVDGTVVASAVDGERTTMHPGDFIITPSWTFHDHGNPGDAPVIWLLGSDALVGLASWKHWRGLFELAGDFGRSIGRLEEEFKKRIVIRKGRENYLCLLNLEDAMQGHVLAGAELVGTYDVSHSTARRALAKLKEMGLTDTVPGYATFVRFPDQDEPS